MSKTRNYSFVVSSFIFSCPPSPIRTSITFRLTTKEKTWVLTSACPTHRGLPQPCRKNKQRNNHVGEYKDAVKCALRIPDPRSTLRRVYTTPRGVTPAFVLVLHIDCGSFDGSKNKASVTPFNM